MRKLFAVLLLLALLAGCEGEGTQAWFSLPGDRWPEPASLQPGEVGAGGGLLGEGV